jgi:hypothetical protein
MKTKIFAITTRHLAMLAWPLLALGGVAVSGAFAGQAQKWEDIPEAVRATVLAHGGHAVPVDLENGKKDGKAIYEAQTRDKNGNILDLVITEDGKLIETKNDDAPDAAQERASQAKKKPGSPIFSHSRDITNPYLPLATLKQDILEGQEDGASVRIERTAKPELRKTFKVGNQKVEALAVEDREYENGQLAEVAMDYFAQADDGTVYYMGEEVNTYENGKVTGHEGAWMYGKDTKKLTPMMPGAPRIGEKFRSEDVSKTLYEEDEVISLSETVKVPAGSYENCLKIKESLSDGKTEYKFFAKGVGCIREVPGKGDVVLKTHISARL